MNFSHTNQLLEHLKKHKVYSCFKYNIWDADLADMHLISKYNKEIRFFLCVIYVDSKGAWDIYIYFLKDTNIITITNAFPKTFDESRLKPNKTWVDKCSELYNRSVIRK